MPTLEQIAAGLQRARHIAATGLQRAHAIAAPHVPDALMVAGAASIAYGAWLVHPSAGFVIGGAFSLLAGVLAAKKGAA